jgi:hypothetical protein
LPGRERQQFMQTPADRFVDPTAQQRNNEPLWRWQCDRDPRTKKQRGQQDRRC